LNEFTSILQECVEYVINKLYDKLIKSSNKNMWEAPHQTTAEVLSLILAREEAYNGVYGNHEINDHVHIAIYLSSEYNEMLQIIQICGYV